MVKKAFMILALAAAFGSGFAFKAVLTKATPEQKAGRVTGIGGIFFKCKDPEKMRQWYKAHLGFDVTPYGARFNWRQGADSATKGYTLWGVFSEKSKYFEPSAKDYMINYRVDNLESLVEQLKKDDVTLLDKIETYDYGKFVHVLDGEGNKIELFEPKL